MPPVALPLRMFQRVAITLRRRSHEKFRMVLPGQIEAVHGTGRADLQGFDTMLQVIDRTSRRSEVEDVIDLAGIEWHADVLMQELETRLIRQQREIVHASGQQIVGADD